MSSIKTIYSSIVIASLFLLAGCGKSVGTEKTFQRIDLSETPLFYYPAIGMLCEAPVSYPEIWNRSALRQMGVHRIVLFSKGGKNPEDTLEKIVLNYDQHWENLIYQGFRFSESREAWTNGSISGDFKNGRIHFDRHYGIDKLTETRISTIPDGLLLLHQKNGSADTTWIFGSFNNPKAIISKIGNSLFDVELFMPEGSSTREIIASFNSFPQTGGNMGYAHCSVTFMKSGLPQRSFLLNETFSQIARIREWTYTADHNIATYQEWNGNSLTHSMSWHYDKSQLPEYTIIDRNTYFYHYE